LRQAAATDRRGRGDERMTIEKNQSIQTRNTENIYKAALKRNRNSCSWQWDSESKLTMQYITSTRA